MKTHNKKLAFSLIELSVVILIIGILIIGITKGTRIIRQAKLTSGQTLTTSSPVNSISGLRMWFETTSAKSFDVAETTDGSVITNWYNNSTQDNSPSPFKVTQGNGTQKPFYTAAGIGNLPTVRFDGNNDVMSGTLSWINSEQATVFIVTRRKTFVSQSAMSVFFNSATNNDNSGAATLIFAYQNTGATLSPFRGGTDNSSPADPGNNVPYILDTVFNGVNNISYLNGVASSPVASTGNFSIDTMAIGSRRPPSGFLAFYNGDISELIFFDRALNTAERRSVEAYLSQKYGIKVS